MNDSIIKHGEYNIVSFNELTLEESQALENSIPVSKALSRYKLVADSKCYEFDVY